MKKSKFTEAQIAFAIKQAESGVSVEEICRKLGVSQQTFYNWKKKYGGLDPTELRRLRQLEEENAKLKKIVADLSLDKQMLQDVLKKKFWSRLRRERSLCSLYYDLGLLDIHVVLASPGVTKTPLLNKTGEDGIQNLQTFLKAGRDFYKPYLDHLKTMSEGSRKSRFFPTPENLAKKLYKIVESKTPKFKYNLAMDAVFMDKIMTKVIPFSWRVAMNKRLFKLTKPTQQKRLEFVTASI
jgi:putative transposase